MNLLRLFRKQNKDVLNVKNLLKDADFNYKIGHYKTAFSGYLQLAEQGYAEAQYKLGKLYYYGKGTYKDQKQAMLWINKADQQNFTQATDFINGIQNQEEYLDKTFQTRIFEDCSAVYYLIRESNLKLPIVLKIVYQMIKILHFFHSDRIILKYLTFNQKKFLIWISELMAFVYYLKPKIKRILERASCDLNQTNSESIYLVNYNRESPAISQEVDSIFKGEKLYWKIAVEKAAAAEWNVPLKKSGDNLKQIYRYFSDLRKDLPRKFIFSA